MRTILILFLFSIIISSQTKTIDQRVDSVLSLMNLTEKVGQLIQFSGGKLTGTKTARLREGHIDLIRKGRVGSFLNIFGAENTKNIQKIAIEESRLKIPLLFGLDVIHGYKTIFPVPLAEASSWDPELVEYSARMQAIEASSAGIHWTFSPMVDIARDPRWGRIVEGSGEDPFLGAVMSAARVNGYQGEKLSDPNSILACAKHFAAYGAAEGGRDYNSVDISERTLREIYLPPFKSAVQNQVGSIMVSFNEINGIPSSANKFLVNNLLKNEWKFNGLVVSDWNSIGELIQHGIADDLMNAAKLAIESGIDIDMESGAYLTYLENLVSNSSVDMELLDNSVRRVLKIKFLLGLFDDPYKYCDIDREKNTILSSDIVTAAREVAKRSIVLLKNDNKILPISKNIKSIAVIGPFANAKDDPLGPWKQEGDSTNVVTIIEGLKNYLGSNTKITYQQGCSIDGINKIGFNDAVKAAENSDLVLLCLGESRQMSGEARNRTSLNLPGIQEELVREIHKTGKPIVVIISCGRTLTINWINENVNGILLTWFLGIQSGNAIADVLFGNYNPSAKLPVTFPRSVGQIPLYYNHKNTGRPFDQKSFYTSKYIDEENSPLYPFGYGLSYTKYDYQNLSLDKSEIRLNESLKVSLEVHNSGEYDGEEIVQLYVRDLIGNVTRPVLELKDFQKVMIKAGETKSIEFILKPEQLKFYDQEMKYVVEPGRFKVYAGPNSKKLLEKEFLLLSK